MEKNFSVIKNDILGKKYSLSVAYISERKSREINKKYRHRDKPTNVLSFALNKNEGEILLCKEVIRKEAKISGENFGRYLQFLVIHGMLHLKGMRHGSIMEEAEKFYCLKYDKKHFDRNRRGLGYDQSRSGRVHQRRKVS